jgi:hypothetical protein
MVKLEGAQEPVVTTANTLASRLLGKNAFDLPTPRGDAIHPTLTTAHTAARLDDEHRFAVVRAGRVQGSAALGPRSLHLLSRHDRSGATPTRGLEPMPPEPVSDAGLASVDGKRDLRQGQTSVDQGSELVRSESAARGVLDATVRNQPVPFDPMADRRGIAVFEYGDLLERKSPVEIPLESIPVHGWIVAPGSDGKHERLFVYTPRVFRVRFGRVSGAFGVETAGARGAPSAPRGPSAARPAGRPHLPRRPRSCGRARCAGGAAC